jgi:hypothetical protein
MVSLVIFKEKTTQNGGLIMFTKIISIILVIVLLSTIYHLLKIIRINGKTIKINDKEKIISLSGCSQHTVITDNLVPISVKWTVCVSASKQILDIESEVNHILLSSIRLVASTFNMQQIHNDEENFMRNVVTTVSTKLDRNNLELVSINISQIKEMANLYAV